MADYRENADGSVERRGGAGRIIGIVALLLVAIVVILFATGFWSADVTKEGSLPEVDVSATGGALPQVDLDSKEVVVGTTSTTVDVPTVETEKKEVSVPVIGVKDNGEN